MRYGDDELPAGIFERDGDHYVPTPVARGPWDEGALHGGGPAALLGRAIVGHGGGGDDGTPWHLARITLELVRPVPLVPLTVTTETVKPGRRVQVVDAVLRAGDDVVTVARGVRMRPTPLPLGTVETEPAPEPPERFEPYEGFERTVGWVAFGDAMEMRFEGPAWTERLGPKACWFRLRLPLVAGEPPMPYDSLLAASDFPNGISSVVTFDRFTFINPDLTVAIARPPVDEWVRVDAATRAGDDSIGWAEALLSDRAGPMGRAVQTLVFGPR